MFSSARLVPVPLTHASSRKVQALLRHSSSLASLLHQSKLLLQPTQTVVQNAVTTSFVRHRHFGRRSATSSSPSDQPVPSFSAIPFQPATEAGSGSGSGNDNNDALKPGDAIMPVADLGALVPINLAESATIEGHETHMAQIKLKPGQSVRVETGALVYMENGIEMDTSLGGGFSAAARRWMTGESLFITDFQNRSDHEATLGLGPDYPSKLHILHLQEHGGSIICQRGAFLCGNSHIAIEMEFTRSFASGFFGGGGFILQRLTSADGTGSALVKAGGVLTERVLEEGEELRVTPGALVAMETNTVYDVEMVKGVKNIVFGEGLFLLHLTGGAGGSSVFLQSLPFDKVAVAIAERLPSGGRLGLPIPVGVGSGGSSSGTAAGGSTAGDIAGAAASGAAIGGTSEAVHRAMGGGEQAPSTSNAPATETPAASDFPFQQVAPQSEFAPEDVSFNDDFEKFEVESGGGGGWFSSLFGDDDEGDDWDE